MAEEKARLTYQDVRDVDLKNEADLSDESFERYNRKKCLGDALTFLNI